MTVRNLANERIEATITKEQLGQAMAQLDLESIPPEKRQMAVMDHLMAVMADSITDRSKSQEIKASRILHHGRQ